MCARSIVFNLAETALWRQPEIMSCRRGLAAASQPDAGPLRAVGRAAARPRCAIDSGGPSYGGAQNMELLPKDRARQAALC